MSTHVIRTRPKGPYVPGSDGYLGWAFQMLCAPSWIWARLPDNSAKHPNSDASVAFLQNVVNKRGTWVNNGGNYGVRFFVAPPGTPLQRFEGRGSAAANSELLAMLRHGIPIPPDFTLDADSVGSFPDLTFEIYFPDYGDGNPEADTLYAGFVTRPPNHPEGVPGYYSVEWGGRMRNASKRAVGHMLDIAAPGGAWATGGERPYWMPSASHLLMTPLSVTRRDWAQKRIDHVLGFMMPAYYIPGQEGSYVTEPPVWPATGADGSSRPAMPMGGRYRIKRSYMTDAQVEAIANPDLRMFVRQGIRYGLVHYDTDAFYVANDGSGNPIPNEPAQPLIYRAEQHALDGMNYGAVFGAYPYHALERIATGSDANFTPTA